MKSIPVAVLLIGLSGAGHAQPAAHPLLRGPILLPPPIQIQPPLNQMPATTTRQLRGGRDFPGNQDLPDSPATEQYLRANPLQSGNLPATQSGVAAGAAPNCAQPRIGTGPASGCP